MTTNTNVQIQQPEKDGPHILKEVVAALQEALRSGDEALVERRRAETIKAAAASVAHYDALDEARAEARLLEDVLVEPHNPLAVRAVAGISLLPKAPPAAKAPSEVKILPPEPVFRVHGRTGPLLEMGETGLLAGEGSAGKSTLVNELALSVVSPAKSNGVPEDRSPSPLHVCHNGPVLWLAYEETESTIAERLLLRAKDRGISESAVDRVVIRDLADNGSGAWALFGPKDRGLYNSRPERLRGWGVLTDTIADVRAKHDEGPALIVIDPLLAAYVGDANSVPPVREFVGALTALARSEKCAILLLAHATKDGRNRGPFDRQQVSGSAAWTDAVRSAMSLSFGDGSGVSGTSERTLAVLKANRGPSQIWTTIAPQRHNGASSGWIIGFERDFPYTWRPREQWVPEEGGKQQKGRKAKTNGAGVRANGGATNGGAECRENGDGQESLLESGVGNGSGDDTLAV